jgi:diaminopimelate decarboxylase
LRGDFVSKRRQSQNPADARVIGVKRTATRVWVSVDGGMSDNPRPALYGAAYTARLLGRLSPAADEHVTVVGQHCEAGDVLIEDELLVRRETIDDLLSRDVG